MNSYGPSPQPLTNAGAAGSYNQQATQTPGNPTGDSADPGFKCTCPICQAQGSVAGQQPTAQTGPQGVPPPPTPGFPMGDTFGQPKINYPGRDFKPSDLSAGAMPGDMLASPGGPQYGEPVSGPIQPTIGNHQYKPYPITY